MEPSCDIVTRCGHVPWILERIQVAKLCFVWGPKGGKMWKVGDIFFLNHDNLMNSEMNIIHFNDVK